MKKILIGAMAALAAGAGGGFIAVSAQSGASSDTGTHLAADTVSVNQPTGYAFRTVDDTADPTFNQLLGINSSGTIAGYFGSGAQGHPNKGYRVLSSAFHSENFPGSVQTQVTGLNDRGVTVGFFSGMNNANQVNDNVGFYAEYGTFHRVAFPATSNANPPVNQLLGVNNDGMAVGFYNDAAGNSHGYEYSIERHRFHTVTVSGATSTTVAGINNHGDVAGFDATTAGVTDGFVLTSNGKLTKLAYPGASMTQALGINDHGEVVGVYQTGTGNGAQQHGFTWTAQQRFTTVEDPNGVGATTVNGVNNAGALVGFYVDGTGNTHGMLATPQHVSPVRHLTLRSMPAGTVSFGRDSGGRLTAHLSMFGLTPGSQHTVEIDAPGRQGPAVRFGALVTADGTGRVDATVTASDSIGALPEGSRFVVRLGVVGGDNNRNAVAAEPIARTNALIAHPSSRAVQLNAVDITPNGVNEGDLSGQATIAFDANKRTLTVTLTASGLTPGNHAAHIHVGSCESQGPVRYMLMDFQANGRGDVVHQTRVVTGVQSLPAPGTWYLNVHQGNSNEILVNGKPALSFRPVLCANM